MVFSPHTGERLSLTSLPRWTMSWTQFIVWYKKQRLILVLTPAFLYFGTTSPALTTDKNLLLLKTLQRIEVYGKCIPRTKRYPSVLQDNYKGKESQIVVLQISPYEILQHRAEDYRFKLNAGDRCMSFCQTDTNSSTAHLLT